MPRPRTVEGGPCWGRAGCTALHGVHSPQRPLEIVLPTLPEFQGTAVSRECLSQFLPPRNVAELRASPRLQGSPEQLRRLSRETGSLSRLFSSVQTTAKCISLGPADCRERLSYSVRRSAATFQRVISHMCESRAGSGIRTGGQLSLEEGGHRGGPSSRQRVRVLQPVLRCSKEGWGATSNFRSAATEPLSQVPEVQNGYCKTGCVSDQIRGLVRHDRSKRRLFPHIHPSQSQEVPEVRFQGQSLPISGSSVRPNTLTPNFHEVRVCCPGSSATPGHPHTQLHRRLVDFSSFRAEGGSTSRCRSRSDERVGVNTKCKEKCAVSITENHLSRRGVGFDHDAGTVVPCSILTTVRKVREGLSLTVKQFQLLLGLMAAASNVIPFGLLYMRPLQWWLKSKGFSPRGNPFRMIKVTRRCLRALDMWRKPWFLSQGPVLGAPWCRVTLATDAFLTRWGAVMSGHPARGLWSGHHLTRHINCLEMLAVFRALKHFLPDIRNHNVLVCTDNTAVVSYINHQAGLRSRPLYKLAHQILVWSQDKFLSLRAVYIPGHLNVGADILSR